MKVLMINGSPNANAVVFTALSAVAATLKEEGIESEIYQIGKDDDGLTVAQASKEILEKMESADGLIIGAPDYFGSPSGKLLSIMDKAFLTGAPFVYKPAASVAAGRRAGITPVLDVINKYYNMTNMPVVPGNYYNTVHGNTAAEVEQDLEGMQTMRALGRNMAWMLKCIEAGKKSGVALPEQEKKIKFSIIR